MFTKSLILSGALVAGLCASDVEKNTDLNTMNLEQIESFFYEKGFKEGIASGYKTGYSDALNYAQARLLKYKDKIEAIEYGKYLTQKGKISAPELYQVYDESGNVEISVMGCRIERPLSPDEIISLPTLAQQHYYNQNMRSSMEYGGMKGKPIENGQLPNNSVDISLRDQSLFSGEMKTPDKDKAVYYYYIENNNFYRNKLDKMNYIYSVKGDKIKVIFPTRDEMEAFKRTFVR